MSETMSGAATNKPDPAAAAADGKCPIQTSSESAIAAPAAAEGKQFGESELILALVGAVGTDLGKVRGVLEDRLKMLKYEVVQIRVSAEVIPLALGRKMPEWPGEFERLEGLMDAGDEAREISENNAILALGVAELINMKRPKDEADNPQFAPKRAYIVSSLKHPDEVAKLREIYPLGFYLIGIYSDEQRRKDYLTKDKGISPGNADTLIKRDADERTEDAELKHGQKLIDTFHLSDFFVRLEDAEAELKQSLWRMLELLFGNPFVTPNFDEYAMFLAFAASLRSADLSRQVGAVIALDDQVVATGANDVPKAGGGQYWPPRNKLPNEITEEEDARDYVLGSDCNQKEQREIVGDILSRAEKAGLDVEKVREVLKLSRIPDLTEYGRIVHAEMDVLLACSRAGILTRNGTLYCTTFPCHNCAKHIVIAGIKRVVFIEPYQKSKAAVFHKDSIKVGFADSAKNEGSRPMVIFEPFVGVGPRRFFDLFSMKLGSGYAIRRKDKETGEVRKWDFNQARLRLQMQPVSYLDLELIASEDFTKARAKVKEKNNG